MTPFLNKDLLPVFWERQGRIQAAEIMRGWPWKFIMAILQPSVAQGHLHFNTAFLFQWHGCRNAKLKWPLWINMANVLFADKPFLYMHVWNVQNDLNWHCAKYTAQKQKRMLSNKKKKFYSWPTSNRTFGMSPNMAENWDLSAQSPSIKFFYLYS